MSFASPAFRVFVFASDLEFWIEILLVVDISTQI